MKVSVAMVRELRESTGAGVMECKKALVDTQGNMEKAIEFLRRGGLAITQKKANRQVTQGVIEVYVHPGEQIGAMVEVNCETDFVARTDEFRELAHNLALQVAAMSPQFVAPEDVPPEMDAAPPEACLLLQPFIKDTTKAVEDVITETIAKVRENVKVRRFARFELGR